MRTEPAMIDLGLYHVADERDREPERAVPPWGWSARRISRWLPPALLVVLLCGTVAAAAPPPPSPITLLWTVSDLRQETFGAVAVGGDSLYVAAMADDGWALTAHRLGDGAVRWSTPLELGFAGRPAVVPEWAVRVHLVGQIPMVTSGHSVRTTAFDPDTGQPRWSHTGQPWYMMSVGANDDRLPLVEWPRGSEGPTLTMVDLVTGALVGHRMPLPSDEPTFTVWWSPAGEGYVFSLRHDGLLSRRAVASGAVVTSRTEHQAPLPMVYTNDLWIVDDLLIVGDGGSDPARLGAYDPVTLEQRWAARQGRWATACGPVVCVDVADGPDDWLVTRIDGIEPSTGEVRWSMRCRGGAFDGTECGISASLLPDGRLWVGQSALDGDPAAAYWFADPASGETLAGPYPPDWRIGGALPGRDLLLSRSERESDPGGEAGQWPTMSWWARSGPDLSRLEILGSTGPGWCYPYAVGSRRYVICHSDGTEPGEVTVWRLVAGPPAGSDRPGAEEASVG